MGIESMTRKEFEGLPRRKWDEEIICDSLIILPGRARDIHDSGFRCMDFVAVVGNEPTCLLSGCSDVIHIDGIGGFGYRWTDKYDGVPKSIPPSGWSIDCLPKSGLLRMWPSSGKIRCGEALSSFEIYAIGSKDDGKKEGE